MPPQHKNPVRRPHSKSRTGCRVCKSRRVKCDETRPACRRCLTHGVQCDFIHETHASTSSTPQDTSNREALSIHQLTSPSATATPELRQSTTWFSVFELELFHHYITSTCLTLANEPTVRNFWRVNVPQVGFSHHYVLRGILSISALHLARLRPRQADTLVEQALTHHSDASSMALPLITDSSDNNFTPIFYFSILTTIITFARPRAPDNFLLISNGVVPDWLIIIRGVRGLLESKGDAILTMSTMDALLYSGMQLNESWEQSTQDHEGLQELENNFKTRVSPQKLPALCGGTRTLKRCFDLYCRNNFPEEERMRAVMTWMIKIPDDFVNLLKSHDSEALCVLAFYCVLLKRLEHFWWIEGWGFHLIERIYSTLDEQHRLWIRWPLEEIGWAP
ncbi:hypothetical protein F5Y19DRAFT_417174 [Xylariaceae sp. FL1651]|nr:hypothetical protein F5Y19DRAFT_417174 [Xylariaceae sp. FL1651]